MLGRLRDALDAARARWPALEVPEDAFVAALALACEDQPPLDVLPRLHAADLYLATACARGDEAAIAAMERECRPALDAALRRFGGSSTFREDVEQSLRERLLVGTSERPPRISEYRGRGSLASWVRVSATRLAVDLSRGRGGREDPTSDSVLLAKLDGQEPTPEVGYLRNKYAAAFREAFERAVQTLSDRETRLLREHYVFGLSTAKVAKLHDAPKSTAARWVAAARDRLIDEVQRELAQGLSIDAGELRSVLRMVRSELHLSLTRVLGEGSPHP